MKIETPAEKVLYCTLRIETEGQEPDQVRAGTAFIFSLTDSEQEPFPCIITNKHVVHGAQRGHFFFTVKKQGKPKMGKRIDIRMDNFEAQWYGHPDPDIDVAAMPLGPLVRETQQAGTEIFWSYLDQKLIPTKDQLDELDVIEEVMFVGYPNGIYDRANLLPVFRRGITATPLQIDHDDKPVFLVDASVFPGSSGSPVLIYNLGGYQTRKGLHAGGRFFFLGVIASVVYRHETGTLEFVSAPANKVPVVRTKEMIDLGIVFKASAVVETVEGLLAILES